jgi:hypothetical protein
MLGAGPVGIIMTIMDKLGIFDAIMKALEPTLDILSGLFELMGGIITAAIMPALEPLNEALISLQPVFITLGQVIGQHLGMAFALFGRVLASIMPVVLPLVEILAGLLQFGFLPLQLVMSALAPVLQLLVPLFNGLAWVLDWVAGGIMFVANGFIDFINSIDIFNWFPDLQRLEKVDMNDQTNTLSIIESNMAGQKDEQITTNELLTILVDEAQGGSFMK